MPHTVCRQPSSAKLETTVGQRIFGRHGRGITLTAAGEQLLPVARHVVEVLDQTSAALRGSCVEQEIRLGIPEEYGDTILPSILASFAQELPVGRVFVRCSSSVDFPDALAAGELDIALHSPLQTRKDDVVVHSERAVWAGSAFHDVETRRPLPVALFDKSCWWRGRCLDLLQKSGLEHQIVCTSQSVAGVRAAIAAGIAIGALPQSTLTDRLRIVQDDKLPQMGETHLVLTASSNVPGKLTDKLAAIVSRVFEGI